MNNCYLNWSLLLEFIKVFLDWPFVVFIIFLIFVRKFEVQISLLLSRVKRWKTGGHEIELEAVAPQTSAQKPVDPNDLLTINASDPQKAKAEILKWWSAARNEAAFNRIFGSQVKLLQHLLIKDPAGDSELNAHAFYGQHLVAATNGSITASKMTDWFDFLTLYGLIERSDQNGTPWVKITPLGKDFLTYARNQYGDFLDKRFW